MEGVKLSDSAAVTDKIRVLFVCMGNICRSPTAEGVFRKLVEEAGLSGRVEVDSAGTHAYHVGAPPDARSQAAAAARGYDLGGLRGRQLSEYDAERFDYVVVMDRGNYNRTVGLFGSAEPSDGQRARVRLFMDFAAGRAEVEVPDPYAGGREGFELVLDMIEEAAGGLLAEISARLAALDAGVHDTSAPPVSNGT